MRERDRPEVASYADCIDDDWSIIDDDWSIIDDDDAVCDDSRDGLTPEEEKAYNLECRELENLWNSMKNELGFFGFEAWRKSYRDGIKR